MWLQRGEMKRETEVTLIAAHDQAITTNAVKIKVHRQQGSPICRMCTQKEESLGHVLSECSKLAQTSYESSTIEYLIWYTVATRSGCREEREECFTH